MSYNDPLAAQLNDLAAANADGLLNDDEYRLLRQNIFERYTGGVEIVSFSPPPPPAVKLPPTPPRRKHVELAPEPVSRPIPTRSKTMGVAGFLRMATGRKQSPAPIKLSFLPRMFSKKSEDTSSSDTDSYGTRHSSSSRNPSGDLSPAPRAKSPPMSPTHVGFAAAPVSPSKSVFSISAPSKYNVIPGGSMDIFDDENLRTSDSIRKAIQAVEAEGRRLVAAFNDLETSAIIRYRQEHPEQSYPTNPRRPSVNPLSHGSTSRSASGMRSYSTSQQTVRSSGSLRTSKSAASLSPAPPPPSSFLQSNLPSGPRSPLLPRPRLPDSLRRKASTSSLSSSSQGGGSSFFSVSGTASTSLSRASSVLGSRSASHLPLPLPLPAPPEEESEELAEVRRRRAEVVGRCEARLEYLRAKLKGAELHEKLLRK